MNIDEIVAVRLFNKIKQYEFAELMGIPIGTWSNIEYGRQPLYAENRAKAERLFKEMDCDFSILEDKEAMKNLPRYVTQIPGHKKEKQTEIETKPAIKISKSDLTTNLPIHEKTDIEHIEKVVQESIAIVKGVGKDEPTVMNKNGGSQSQVLYRLDLIDPKALFATAKVLKEGADKYGAENWRLIDLEDHLNHLLIHTYAYLAGDRTDEHLSHIVCRALFALGVDLQTDKDLQKLNQ